MPRIAILADIHGNTPAFDAVAADIDAVAPDEVIVAGDLVGRGPQGNAVVERVIARGWRSVRGNHEDYLINFRRNRVDPTWLISEDWSAARWMAAELTPDSLAFIETLPFSLTAETAPNVRVVHGTPRSNNEGIGPWTHEETIRTHLAAIAEPVLVCAHTHKPLEYRLDDGLVVNTGSVGLPFNNDQRAQYVILHVEGSACHVEFRRVEYELTSIVEIYSQTGFLTAGGVTAQLLLMELSDARPYLAPFLAWATSEGVAPQASQLNVFLEQYRRGRT
jgi:predicted phosphodiesterase